MSAKNTRIARRAERLLRTNNLDLGGEPAVATFARALVNSKGEQVVDFSGADTPAEVLAALGGAGSVDYSGSKVIYVSKGANATDTRTGLSKYDQTRPFSTITAAVGAAESGDVVFVLPGNYSSESGTTKEGVVILTSPNTTLPGSFPNAFNSSGFTLIGGGEHFFAQLIASAQDIYAGYDFITNEGGGLAAKAQSEGYTGVFPYGAEGSERVEVRVKDVDRATIYEDKVVLESGVHLSHGLSGPVWKSGLGSPEGVVAAPVGSLYSRTDGGAGTSLYVKQSGTGTTGWAAK